MGCISPRENLEDQIMIIKIKKVAIQMERENYLKILSEIEGRKINEDNFPEYLVSRNVKISKNINMRYDEENNEAPNEIKIENNNKTNVPQILNQGSTKENELDENQNEYKIKRNKINNQNESQPLTVNSKIIKKIMITKKKRKVSSRKVNNNNKNENNNKDKNNL